jgi:adenylosuccinate synthase
MTFLKHGFASVVIDGQFGSTGKGLAAAYQCLNDRNTQWSKVICTTNAAPNAGHTTVLSDGTKFVTFHMPTMAVIRVEPLIYLNAGAIIDMTVLKEEIETLKINPSRITIHPNAAVITDEDKEYEKSKSSGVTAIASTQKGVGRALAKKVMRESKVAKDYALALSSMGITVGEIDLNSLMRNGWAVDVETPQGMSLSLNNGFYPHCTSREVSVSQSLSDACIHPSYLGRTLAVIRTFPIRVGNIIDIDGKTIGFSGGGYPDQVELDWSEFQGVEPEKTTVTQRIRRIFTFSETQYHVMMSRFKPDIIHMGFCDYLKSVDHFDHMMNKIRRVHATHGRHPEILCSFGPSVDDVCSVHQAWERIKNERHPK